MSRDRTAGPVGADGVATEASVRRKPFTERMLDGVETLGNKAPHPVLLFLYLMLVVIVLSQILAFAGVRVTEQVVEPVPYPVRHNYYEDTTQVQSDVPSQGNQYSDVEFQLRHETTPVRGMLTGEGIRYIFTSFVANMQNFGVIAVVFIAMLGAGIAEGTGLLDALVRRLVSVAPARLVTFLIVFLGALSSIAQDAGYLILIPLAVAAFVSLRRHPLAGLAAGFAGVGGTFGVNLIIQPTDAMLTEITNETVSHTGGQAITVVHNYFFGAASLLVLCVIATVVTERLIEPRLGVYAPVRMAADEAGSNGPSDGEPSTPAVEAAEARGLRFALFGFLAVFALVMLATLPPGAPLRDPQTGAIIGATPFMDSLLFIIMLCFVVAGICYGVGAKTVTSSDDVIEAATNTFNSLGGLVLMLLMVAQFIAYFNYSNIPRVAAVALGDLLERSAIAALPLLIGFIVVSFLLTFILPSIIPKWALFAPVFIPIFMRLGIGPQTLLAAYRIGDSPVNMLTPLNVYFPFIVTLAQRYQKDAGVGTVLSLMVPYALIMWAAWILLFVLWFVLGIPLGPGYPVRG